MICDGLCQCINCQKQVDPTVEFQHCAGCGGKPVLVASRYQCEACESIIDSIFRLEPIRFDDAYFSQAMARHRQRRMYLRKQLLEQLRNGLSRSVLLPAANLDLCPGLAADLDQLTEHQSPPEVNIQQSGDDFDLAQYEKHIIDSLSSGLHDFEDIPPINDSPVDRVRRFVAAVFLDHAGQLTIQQDGSYIELYLHETHRKRHRIPEQA